MIQELFDKLVFQRYFKITYLGQLIQCSIEFPNSQSINQKRVDLGQADDKNRTLEIQIKLNTYYPIINQDTEISSSSIINNFNTSIVLNDTEDEKLNI